MVMMMMMMLMIQGEAAPAKNHRFRRIDHTAKFSPEGCWGLATQLTADPNYQASYMASMNFQIDGQCTVDPNARPDFTSCTSTLNMVTNMFSKVRGLEEFSLDRLLTRTPTLEHREHHCPRPKARLLTEH